MSGYRCIFNWTLPAAGAIATVGDLRVADGVESGPAIIGRRRRRLAPVSCVRNPFFRQFSEAVFLSPLKIDVSVSLFAPLRR